ncbi:MAG: chromosome segregation SMC family protein [Thaumarchaeota archaeon]|nr:chromosome segregation SMC family protein [Nitrososphaerota archaeon]
MVHVKKVEIFGFKSFGFKNTTVHFEPGLVSISGPNGSGKSNILDAIIFAMGENKPKVMRVDKLRSLIHDIEGNRRGTRMARSSVHFDNTDRKIPFDSDAVEITREMDEKGENTYYFNKKKTTRSHILNLLDLANAGLGQLNAVQQGTVTRISEMTSDEKRTTIENMLGLSYFDEKKTDALKELDDADVRLKIALTKMEGIKERLEELEEERNQKLRYDLLQKELARYMAIDAANKLKTTLASKSSKESSLQVISNDIEKLVKDKDVLSSNISKLDAEKSDLMGQANEYNNTKSKIDTELSEAKREHDAEYSTITMSQKRMEQIKSRLPDIKSELQEINDRRENLSNEITLAQESLDDIDSKKKKIYDDNVAIDLQQKTVLKKQSQVATRKSEIDKKLSNLNADLNTAKLKLDKIDNEIQDTHTKITSNSERLENLKNDIPKLSESKQRLVSVVKNHKDTIENLTERIEKLEAKRSKITTDMDDLEMIMEKSNKAANQYESKIKTVKGFMHEDYTVAKLKVDADKLGIIGLAYELISWDKKYERSVLAVSSDWLKAVIVKDFATLLDIAEFARSKKLPKLKIIPLEAIPNFSLNLPKRSGVLGVLSDYVRCDYQYVGLKTFLFGNIILADTKETARTLSKSGYKSVSLDGEFFEARGDTVVIDINSKISKLTKLISMSTDIEGLFSSIKLIKRYRQKQKNSFEKMGQSIATYAKRRSVSENAQTSASEVLTNLESRMTSADVFQKQLESRMSELHSKSSSLVAEKTVCQSHIESISERIEITKENYADGEQDRIAQDLSRINEKKSELEYMRTQIMEKYDKASSKLKSLQVDDGAEQSATRRLKDEESSLLQEVNTLESDIEKRTQIMKLKHDYLVELRQKEQDLISSSGSSIGNIQEYDVKIKKLSADERNITKDINTLQRKFDSLDRDIKELVGTELKLRQIAKLPSSDMGMDDFDVAPMVQALSVEKQSLESLNAKAPENYLKVYEGYRAWSPRKNALEDERNRIVKFIEGVEKEKRQVFLDAFDKVDKEIRLIFKNMTSGNAWLELQNEDDIFNSGISYLIQFPNKPKRESTSISGGEKTLAAIVFVLALQKLQPSPFYLFDEIDAHLDAPNSERLAKILEERSRESQFIMVSLKDSVVQKAKLIYGVYPKNGVSNVVTYKDRRMPQVS